MDYLAILSLLFLLGIIVIASIRNINVGIVSFALAMILGTMGGISPKDILADVPVSLFFTLFGTMLFFGILKNNGTTDLLAKKLLGMAGTKAYLVPIAVCVISYSLAALGPGAFTVLAITQGLVVIISVKLGLPPVLMASMSSIGACTGSFAPIAISGIIARALAVSQGMLGMQWKIFGAVSVVNLLVAIIIYFIFRGYEIKFTKPTDNVEDESFNSKQRISLFALAVLIISVLAFSLDIGIASCTLAGILIMLKAGTQKEALSSIPWRTLVLITGIGVLLQITLRLRGVDLLVKVLEEQMVEDTAPALMSITASIMSFFSSSLQVVMPTLVAKVPVFVQNFGGDISPMLLIVSVCTGAQMSVISPLSAGGALSLAAFVQNAENGKAEAELVFKNLFISSAVCTLVTAILSLVGISLLFF